MACIRLAKVCAFVGQGRYHPEHLAPPGMFRGMVYCHRLAGIALSHLRMSTTLSSYPRAEQPAAASLSMKLPDCPLPADALRMPRPYSRVTGVQILAVGAFAPPEVVRNEDLAHLGCDPEWIVQRTGIRQRRRAADGVATSDLAAEAARRCLAAAGAQARDVDLIVLATMTPDSAAPSTACRVQTLIGASCPAMDLNAACSGFMYALATGMQFVKTGCARRVLVIGAEVMTRLTNPADVKTYSLFGDGAGAALVGPGSDDQGFVSYSLGADGSGGCLLEVPGGGSREPLTAAGLAAGRQYMSMDGRAVFKWAVRLLGESVGGALSAAELTPADIDYFVLHQANRRILDAAAADLGFDPARLVMNLDRYGNTSAASIPLVLDDLRQANQLQRGTKLLLCGFGAGLTWGTGVFQV
jgi:3-oxoacyl-[acyl-carrier-protein] synthase-3